MERIRFANILVRLAKFYTTIIHAHPPAVIILLSQRPTQEIHKLSPPASLFVQALNTDNPMAAAQRLALLLWSPKLSKMSRFVTLQCAVLLSVIHAPQAAIAERIIIVRLIWEVIVLQIIRIV